MKVEDPNTGKLISAIRRTYKLKMKAGTTGIIQDPHRPEIADFLENIPGDWSVNQGKGTIKIDCPENIHDKLIHPPRDDDGILLFQALIISRG